MGKHDGTHVGIKLGVAVGVTLGEVVGRAVGRDDGPLVGVAVGTNVGLTLGPHWVLSWASRWVRHWEPLSAKTSAEMWGTRVGAFVSPSTVGEDVTGASVGAPLGTCEAHCSSASETEPLWANTMVHTSESNWVSPSE